ncbi:C-type lectin domain family 4 member M-like [Asterias amurensis]|uniref:C-type lectin domain family 4 member M-like n=1 Tax=Asterias amurensis TaxID=7602 RepID=UPI003AB18A31
MWSILFPTLLSGLFLIAKYTAGEGQCVASIGGRCPPEWELWRSKCYKVITKGPWSEAKLECYKIGGTMVVPQSMEEIIYLAELQYEYWIGCTDIQTEDTWVCEEGAKYFELWHSGEPGGGDSENCMEIYARSLNDKPCDAQVPAICQRDILPKLHL